MSRPVRTPGDKARREIFHWHKALRAASADHRSRQDVVSRGGEIEDIIYHMSVDNIRALTDDEALEVLRFDSSLDGCRPGPAWARQLLQEDEEEDIFFTSESPKASNKGGRPKAEWTEEAWFALFREMLHKRNFHSVSEVSDFLHSHLIDQGISCADSTVKAKAREFWSRCGLNEND